jgi:hypothetical protein
MKNLSNLATFDNMLDDRTPYNINAQFHCYGHRRDDVELFHVECKLVEKASYATTRIYKREHML